MVVFVVWGWFVRKKGRGFLVHKYLVSLETLNFYLFIFFIYFCKVNLVLVFFFFFTGLCGAYMCERRVVVNVCDFWVCHLFYFWKQKEVDTMCQPFCNVWNAFCLIKKIGVYGMWYMEYVIWKSLRIFYGKWCVLLCITGV